MEEFDGARQTGMIFYCFFNPLKLFLENSGGNLRGWIFVSDGKIKHFKNFISYFNLK